MLSPKQSSRHSTLTKLKRISQKVFNCRQLRCSAKSPFFSVVSFAIIFLIIYTDSIVSNLSMQTDDPRTHQILEHNHQTQIPEKQIESMSPLPSMQENIDDIADEIHDPLIPPENATKEERLGWFRRKLPELDVLNSDNLTKQFHGRVLEFLNNGCSSQFYMIWLSPANSFGKRDFLAMDTLFKSNPQGCLMIISKSMDSGRGYRILKPLLDKGFKILAITPDLPFLSGRKDPGRIPLSQNLANLIRLTMLYKYGGIYLDTDLVILEDFSGLRNAVGAQSVGEDSKQWTRLNGAVMIFDLNHPILIDFLEEFSTTFNGNKWVGSTPGYNLTILPPKAFYPVDWNRIHRLFKKPQKRSESRAVEITLNELNDRETYAGSVMARLMSEHCVICQDIYTS
ncbi:lactosylceramide 4-alpha-galactosyltransferase-like [Pyrus ussuriensis x Pyrus communis]|uniref:Lactosylceramide 4-alpha-galactosyltransferase-like n=1 Tax=Pyrus ussuriensis x Pyrus communis TaxID=2448454 RepID=A0A5N5HWE8_9ROSA|nr:lactosylceramide 4-alpha-galactosyltransferase-like [Pyrus ussuriensis x Pyrus communis]